MYIDVRFYSPTKQAALESLNVDHLYDCATALESELIQTASTLEGKGGSRSDYENGQHFAMEVTFTHNDLLSGNVLIPLDFFENDASSEVKFIDYEYAGFNPRAFDIANHFCGKEMKWKYVYLFPLNSFVSLIA